jgi:16S rRNA (cytidine1402-2'-O)-methyltransferase
MLSMVGTPIGNLQDMSPRAIAALRDADVILCEDTRVTSRLLSRFDIHTRLERCDENVIARRVRPTLERVWDGERVAFVSDAGMPGVSDPGQALVDAALDEGLPIEVIPGPSAVTCALVASGLGMEHFFFEGFLPRKEGSKTRRLQELAAVPGALVVYESPHRVADTVDVIARVMPLRRVALVRELTKLHEEVVREPAPVLAERLGEGDEVRGECVIVIEGPVEGEEHACDEELPPLEDQVREALRAGEPKSALAKRIAAERGIRKRDVYDLAVSLEDAEV